MYKRCTWATLKALGFQIGIYDNSLTNMLTTPLSQFVEKKDLWKAQLIL
jgi:hypothetical protein